MSQIINLGKIIITPEGEFDYTKEYQRLSMVVYEGDGFISLKPSQGVIPGTDETVWKLAVRKGTAANAEEWKAQIQEWVREQGFLTQHQSLQDYYTKDQVVVLLDAKADTEDLSPVAFSGQYSDLSGTPDIASYEIITTNPQQWDTNKLYLKADEGVITTVVADGTEYPIGTQKLIYYQEGYRIDLQNEGLVKYRTNLRYDIVTVSVSDPGDSRFGHYWLVLDISSPVPAFVWDFPVLWDSEVTFKPNTKYLIEFLWEGVDYLAKVREYTEFYFNITYDNGYLEYSSNDLYFTEVSLGKIDIASFTGKGLSAEEAEIIVQE